MARGRFTRLHREAGVGTGLAATGTEVKFVCFVVSTMKQIRAASVPKWAQGLAFTANKLASVPVWLRPVLKPNSCASRVLSRLCFGWIRLWWWSFSEAPSWSFSESSPNDSEGASVGFMALTAENPVRERP